jgi:hypothetical protein
MAYFEVLSRRLCGETEENHAVRIVDAPAEIRKRNLRNTRQKRYPLSQFDMTDFVNIYFYNIISLYTPHASFCPQRTSRP